MRLALLSVFLLGTTVFAAERLVLVGGGDYPPAAIRRFVDWAGGPKTARLLHVGWANAEPAASHQFFAQSVGLPLAQVEAAPFLPDMPAKKAFFLTQLQRATGVFFAGGDQNRIMDLLDKEPELVRELRRVFGSGVVFGGTSAGTAVMAETMITGDGDFTVIDPKAVDVRPGLGLLRDLIVDQHFIRRGRWNRVLSLLEAGKERHAVGIDEDTALAVENGSHAEVIGPSQVAFLETDDKGKFLVQLVGRGGKFNLAP